MPPLNSAESERFAARVRALGHPVRLQVLDTLARGQGCQCGEIVAGLPLAQSTVSQHIKVLLEAGLVRGRVDGPRSCYCLDHAALAGLRAELDGLFARLDQNAPGIDPEPDRAAPAALAQAAR